MRKSSRRCRFSLKFCQAGPFLTEIFPGRAGLGRFSLIFFRTGLFQSEIFSGRAGPFWSKIFSRPGQRIDNIGPNSDSLIFRINERQYKTNIIKPQIKPIWPLVRNDWLFLWFNKNLILENFDTFERTCQQRWLVRTYRSNPNPDPKSRKSLCQIRF